MRFLTLVRHAKSSWDYQELSDFERPLNPRGRRDAPVMAARVRKLLEAPDLLVSSPASRALSTAQIFARELGLEEIDIRIQPRVYEADVDSLFGVLRGLDPECRHAMLFGHNPGLSQLAQELARCSFDLLPTCGVAHFRLAIGRWEELTADCGKLLLYTYPKQENLPRRPG
jgi:phosphohistidine phosphatase